MIENTIAVAILLTVCVGWLVFDRTFSEPFHGNCVGSSCD